MSGHVVLSWSGSETRMGWWRRFRAEERWALVLPTRTQVALTWDSYPRHGMFFSTTTTLGWWAAQTAVATGLNAMPVGEQHLVELCEDAGVGADAIAHAQQIWAWHLDGKLTAAEAPAASPSRAVLERIEATIGGCVATEAWCMVALAEALPPDLPRLYVEHVDVLAPVERQLLQALSRRTDVIVRVRDVVDAPPLERLFRPMIEALIADGDWSGSQDPPPDDARARQALAEVLFGDGPAPMAGAERLRYASFDSVDEELAAIAARVRALLDRGVWGANILVALPDAPSYRLRAAQAFAGLPLRMLFPAAGAPAPTDGGVCVIAHADLAGRTAMCTLVGGCEGARDAEPAHGGFTRQAAALLPSYLLDAVERCVNTLHLSAVRGTGDAHRSRLVRAVGGRIADWSAPIVLVNAPAAT